MTKTALDIVWYMVLLNTQIFNLADIKILNDFCELKLVRKDKYIAVDL